MNNNNDPRPFGATIQDVHNTANDLRKLIAECATKEELEKHYYSANRVTLTILGVGILLCSAYYLANPIFIRSETSKLETKIDEIKVILIDKDNHTKK